MNRSNTFVLLSCSALLLSLSACGGGRGTDMPPPSGGDGGAPPPPPSMSVCGDSSRTGITDCLSDCNPGQWCDDTEGVRECKPGCTSDLNCGPTEYCDRPAGQAVGSCASCSGVTFGEPRPSCVSPGRDGWSDCLSDCAPGQYCNDTEGVRFCEPGCTSDANCGPNDSCVRGAGEAIGVCASCYDIGGSPPPPPPGGDCEDACRLGGTICDSIGPAEVGACVTTCPMVGETERTAFIACVDAAAASPNPCSVTECFGGGTSTGSCEAACDDGAFYCGTGEVLPTEVATCKATCETASSADAEAFVNCIDAAFFAPEPCAQRQCFDVFL